MDDICERMNALTIKSLDDIALMNNIFKNEQENSFSFDDLKRMLSFYTHYRKTVVEANQNINGARKIRAPNFPSEISENIAKYALFLKYGTMPNWQVKSGDLEIFHEKKIKKIEVKGFTTISPSSFGPTEAWDHLVFVDGCDFEKGNFKVFEIKLSNVSEQFGKIKLNKTQTFKDVADQKKRGRGEFYKIFKPFVEDHCEVIFNGHLEDLNFPKLTQPLVQKLRFQQVCKDLNRRGSQGVDILEETPAN